MAHIHIEQIKDIERNFTFDEKPGSYPALANLIKNKECEFLAPVRTQLRATRIGDIFEAVGSVQTRIQMACSRCLSDFQFPVQSKFALTYTREVPETDAEMTDTEIELRYEDMGLIYFSGEIIDLQPDIATQVMLAMPVKPLCSETCKGLCPTCGIDLNKEACRCERTPLNNQFAALRDLDLKE
jgi:uncharacterized protein